MGCASVCVCVCLSVCLCVLVNVSGDDTMKVLENLQQREPKYFLFPLPLCFLLLLSPHLPVSLTLFPLPPPPITSSACVTHSVPSSSSSYHLICLCHSLCSLFLSASSYYLICLCHSFCSLSLSAHITSSACVTHSVPSLCLLPPP